MKESLGRILLTAKLLEPWQILVLNRHLSEESLSQQVIAMRFKGVNNALSIREFRRLVSGIYHGLLSLGITGSGHHPKFNEPRKVSCPYWAGPSDPNDYFFWLCVIHYRATLEAPPSWRLSRDYALDRLKLDLLAAMDRPFDLLRPYSTNKSFSREASMLTTEFQNEAPDLLEDMLINITHAATGISDAVKTGQIEKHRSLIAAAAM